MNTAPMVRLTLIFAAESMQAVILRRSKSQLYNLIHWDRENDTFTEGQWLKQDVLENNAALTPDGRHLIYTVKNANPNTRATECYTVISRPPYFTALALFPHGWNWPHGGQFLDNGLYIIGRGDPEPDELIGAAAELTRVYHGKVTKDCKTGLRLANGKAAPLSKPLRERLLHGQEAPAPRPLDRYATKGGRLFRRNGMEQELIRDFCQMEPRFFKAPYDTRLETREDARLWHPLGEA